MDRFQARSNYGNGRSIYKAPIHTSQAFEVLNILRRQNLLCDVTLIADGIEILAHKAILASCSPYFFAMFTSDLSESRSDKITIKDIDSKVLAHLVDFMYTAEMPINEDNVQCLLPAANLLQLADVQEACCDFLQTQLHPTNCLGICAFADLHSCTSLMETAEAYTELHFCEVIECEEFFSLSASQVCKFITSDRISVPSEEKVFEAVISWVNYDLPNRQDFIGQLIEHVRLPLLSQEYLVERVEEETLIKGNIICKDYLIEALKYHLLKGDQKILYRSPRTKPRSPIKLPKILLVVGGQAPKAIRSVECFDFKDERWSQVADMPSRRCRAGMAVLNGLVYAVGGFNGSLRVRTVDIYDPSKDCWAPGPSMEARRSTLGVAVLNGLIYAVGGFDGSSGLSSVECFNAVTTEWSLAASMSTRRSSVGVGVINGLLYAVGGYDGASRQCLSSVECYDPQIDKWSSVADMSVRRSGAGVGVVESLLYAVGGHDGPLVRKTVECYNPELNQWISVSDMNFCRRNAGVVSANDLLYVIGGDDGSSNLVSVEVYNPKADIWTVLTACMNIGRSYAGVAVIDKPF